ncbi:hypothetical protein NQU49_27900, partial [Escherichia coli]|nr:hypothetical protein [Escherichia coli]
GSQRSGDCAGDAVALVAVVQDVEKGECCVFVDFRRSRWVYQVPGRADVSVWYIKGLIKRFQRPD